MSECQCWVGLQTVPVSTLNPPSGNRSTLYQTTKPGLAPSLWLTVNSPPAQSQQCCYSVSQLNGYYTPLCVFVWLWQVNYWTSLCHEDNWPVKPLWNLIHLLHFITALHLTVCKPFYKQLVLGIALTTFRTACELIIRIINANDLLSQHELNGGLIFRPAARMNAPHVLHQKTASHSNINFDIINSLGFIFMKGETDGTWSKAGGMCVLLFSIDSSFQYVGLYLKAH